MIQENLIRDKIRVASGLLNPLVLSAGPSEIIHRWRTLPSVLLSHQHQFIYYRVPKAANTYLLYLLYRMTGGLQLNEWNRKAITYSHFHHLGGSSLRKRKNLLSDYYKFIAVRNPFTRILSAYLQKFSMPSFKARFPTVCPVDGTENVESFIDFLTFLKEGALTKDPHWIPQSYFAWPTVEAIDFVIKVETLEADLARLSEEIEIPLPSLTTDEKFLIGMGSKPTRSSSLLKRFYEDPEHGQKAKELVIDIYRNDFDCFGYSKMIP